MHSDLPRTRHSHFSPAVIYHIAGTRLSGHSTTHPCCRTRIMSKVTGKPGSPEHDIRQQPRLLDVGFFANLAALVTRLPCSSPVTSSNHTRDGCENPTHTPQITNRHDAEEVCLFLFHPETYQVTPIENDTHLYPGSSTTHEQTGCSSESREWGKGEQEGS